MPLAKFLLKMDNRAWALFPKNESNPFEIEFQTRGEDTSLPHRPCEAGAQSPPACSTLAPQQQAAVPSPAGFGGNSGSAGQQWACTRQHAAARRAGPAAHEQLQLLPCLARCARSQATLGPESAAPGGASDLLAHVSLPPEGCQCGQVGGGGWKRVPPARTIRCWFCSMSRDQVQYTFPTVRQE